MPTYIITYLAALVSFVAFDTLWLTLSAKKIYSSYIGHLLTSSFNYKAAGIFYVIYALGITLLVVLPAIDHNYSLAKTFLLGALLGLVAYATFDLTGQAAFKNWSLTVTIIDLVWGTLISGIVSIIALAITKYFA